MSTTSESQDAPKGEKLIDRVMRSTAIGEELQKLAAYAEANPHLSLAVELFSTPSPMQISLGELEDEPQAGFRVQIQNEHLEPETVAEGAELLDTLREASQEIGI